jgi:CHAT domain-containing protein
VIDYCEQQLSAPARSEDKSLNLHLQISKANAQVAAGDLKAAIASYQNLQSQITSANGEEFGQLAEQVAEALAILQFQFGESPAPAIDYDVRPFAHPYYWAPFILVGDWK